MKKLLVSMLLLAVVACNADTTPKAEIQPVTQPAVKSSVPSATVADTLIQSPTAEQLAKAVPLNNTICPITKEKVGSMGEGPRVIYKGQIVNLCCGGCVSGFVKDPAAAMKVVAAELGKK